MLESLFNKVADLQGRNFLKKIQQRCVHGNIAKLSRALILKNICEWLYNCSCLFVSPVIFSVTNFPTQLNGFKWSYWYQIGNILVSNCYVPKGLKEQMRNRVICLIILFNHRVRVIEMSKMAHFLYFLVVTAKKSKVWAKCSSAPERSCCVLLENRMVNMLWSYFFWDTEGTNIKKLLS